MERWRAEARLIDSDGDAHLLARRRLALLLLVMMLREELASAEERNSIAAEHPATRMNIGGADLDSECRLRSQSRVSKYDRATLACLQARRAAAHTAAPGGWRRTRTLARNSRTL